MKNEEIQGSGATKERQENYSPSTGCSQKSKPTALSATNFATWGGVVKDPSKTANGQVWTQNQCLAHAHIKAALGATRPENIVKLSENAFWVIEAKASRRALSKALDEAIGLYANEINSVPGQARAFLATGVAGNEDFGYLVSYQGIHWWPMDGSHDQRTDRDGPALP